MPDSPPADPEAPATRTHARADDPRSPPWPASRARGRLTVRLRDGRVDDVQLRIFEAPRFFEALLQGRSIARGPRYHRPDLRHLPRRLPDELVPRPRGVARPRAPRRRCASCAGCSTAASGSRAIPCTLPSCMHPTSSDSRVPSQWRRPPRVRRAGPRGARSEEGRQCHRPGSWAAARSIRSTSAGRVLPASHARKSSAALARSLEAGRRISLVRWSAGRRASTFLTSNTITSSWRCGTRPTIR